VRPVTYSFPHCCGVCHPEGSDTLSKFKLGLSADRHHSGSPQSAFATTPNLPRRIRERIRLLTFLLLLILPCCAFAQGTGGSCPSAANYINPADPSGPRVTLASLGVKSCYFVSKSMGSDGNAGTSEGSPLARLPGMASYAGSITPSAGEGFILRGCDVWTASDLPIAWQWSGSSSNPIYIGVDQTWYNTSSCASGWNRPVWNGQGKAVNGNSNNYFLDPSSDGTGPVTVENHDVTFDNVEMTGLQITSSTSGGYINWVDDSSYNMTFSNMYLHGWNATADNCILIQGPYRGGSSHNVVYENNVVDGSDRTGSSGTTGACYIFYTSYSGVKILNNVFRYVVNPFVGYTGAGATEIGGNLFAYGLNSIAGANHCNMIETLGGGIFYIHDNVIHDLECSGGENMMLGDSGETDYVWNNIIYNVGSSQTPNGPEVNNATGLSLYFWNNTVVDPGGIGCFFYSGQGGDQYNVINFQNNHCISGASSALGGGFNVKSLTNANNVLVTAAIAASAEYTSSETYVYSPWASTSSTVGVGTNLTANWPSGFSTKDTSYGCTEASTSGVTQVVCPARTSNTRPSSGAWNAGAYEFAGGPPPPTNVQAVAH
jgi:hypothetical protein